MHQVCDCQTVWYSRRLRECLHRPSLLSPSPVQYTGPSPVWCAGQGRWARARWKTMLCTGLLLLQMISTAGAVARIIITWCRVKTPGHCGDMMTGSPGANAAQSFEGAEPAVNIEETCQQAVETLGCYQRQSSWVLLGSHRRRTGLVIRQVPGSGVQKWGARQPVHPYSCGSWQPRMKLNPKKFKSFYSYIKYIWF